MAAIGGRPITVIGDVIDTEAQCQRFLTREKDIARGKISTRPGRNTLGVIGIGPLMSRLLNTGDEGESFSFGTSYLMLLLIM